MNRRDADNVILISLDCVRPDSLGCYGSAEIETPVIDSIAGECVRFTEAISQAPFTPASHASVFTGLNPNSHGIRYMIGQKMRPVPTLAEVFHSAGWSTAAFVGASAMSKEYGLDRGFNVYDEDFEQRNTNWILGFRRDCEESTSRAIDWIKDRRKYFLFIHYFDAHCYDGELVSRSTQKRGLELIDPQIKRLLDHAKLCSAVEKTAVIIFSDHGDSITEHGENGHLEYLFDTTLRIPLIMRLPGLADKRVIEDQVRAIDIFTTLLDYFGLLSFLPERAVCDGTSLIPLIRGREKHESPPAFSETYMEAGQKKGKTTTTRYFSVRTDKLKVIYEKISSKWEGYDLLSDPDETSDVYTDDDPRFSELKDRLMKYISRGEELEEVRMMTEEEGQVLRSLEALGYVEASASQPGGDMAFFSALNDGKKLINLGKNQQAVEKINKALSMQGIEEGLRCNARMGLAGAYHRLNRNDKAVEQLEQILKGPADSHLSARASVFMANIVIETDSVEKGISVLDGFLDESRSLTPEAEVMVRARRAALCRELHQDDKAIDDYEWILRKSPQNIDACYNLGSLFKHIGNYARAQACFQQVLRISTPLPDKYHGGAHYHLADISLKRSLRVHAEDSLRQCLRINPRHGAAREKLDQVSSPAE